MSRATEIYRRYQELGWYPVRWAHHPQAIRDLIRRARFRPGIKQCYDNCSQIMRAARGTRHARDLCYAEGYWSAPEVPPLPHAWLLYRGEICDPTITDAPRSTYDAKLVLTAAEYRAKVAETGRHGNFLVMSAHPVVQSIMRFMDAQARASQRTT